MRSVISFVAALVMFAGLGEASNGVTLSPGQIYEQYLVELETEICPLLGMHPGETLWCQHQICVIHEVFLHLKDIPTAENDCHGPWGFFEFHTDPH